MKLSIIIPVYNERATVLELLARVQDVNLGPGWEKEVLIVDNCSTDGTRELLATIDARNVTVILQPSNRGKGTSVRRGIESVTGDYTILQDADLEYDPTEYTRLLEAAISGDFDVVYGSRVLNGRRYHHYAANFWAVKALSSLTNLLFGTSYTDVATNYKLVRTSILKSLNLTCSGFDLDFEISNKLGMATARIAEVPIAFAPRTYAEGKKIRAVDGLRAVRVIFRDWLQS